MSTVTPPPAVTPGPAQPVTASGTVASFTNLPPGLANLAAGAILTGSVIGRDGQGHVLVQTNNGVLSLSTALALTPGSTISLQLQTTGAQIQMVILSINQQPLPAGAQATATLVAAPGTSAAATPAPASPAPAAAAQAAPAQTVETPAVLVSAGRWLTATIVQPAAASGTAPAQNAAAAAGQAAATSVPGQAPVVAPGGILAGTPPHEALQILSALFNRPAAREAEVAQKGARLPLRIVAFEPNPEADPQTVMRAAAQGRVGARLLAANVLEPDGAGNLQVQTALGRLSVSAKLPLPPNSQIVFEILGALEPPPPPGGVPAASALAHGRGWPALDEALTVLAKADPEQFRHLTERVIPRAGAELANSLMLAAAAVKTGHFSAFLGERTLRALTAAGHHDLAAHLGEDFRQLMLPVHGPSGGDWRSYLIPVHDGSHVQFIRMYTQQHRRRNQSEADTESAARFLVEVDLSRLGALQFDGLVKAKKFDLIIRSHAPLDPAMRREIGRIFADATSTAGFTGSIAFQPGGRFAQAPVRPGSAPVGIDV